MPAYESRHLLRVLDSSQDLAKSFIGYCKRHHVTTRGLCRVGYVQRAPPPNAMSRPDSYLLRGLIANKDIAKDENVVMMPVTACLHPGAAFRCEPFWKLLEPSVQATLSSPAAAYNSRLSDRSLVRHNQLLLALYMTYLVLLRHTNRAALAGTPCGDAIDYIDFMPRNEGNFEQLSAHLSGWLDAPEVSRSAQATLAAHFQLTQAEVRPLLIYALCMIYSRMVPVDHRGCLQYAAQSTPFAHAWDDVEATAAPAALLPTTAAAGPAGQANADGAPRNVTLVRDPVSFLCPVIDMCNHSERENVAVMVPDREASALTGPVICLRTLRAITKGEELTMTYGAAPHELKLVWGMQDILHPGIIRTTCNGSALPMRGTRVRSQGTGRQWMQRQSQDPFVAKARQEGYIARSAYKLLHMDDRYHLFDRQRTRVVMDLGCSPGGWCQVVRQRAGDRCFLLGVDLLPVQAQVPNAVIVQGDFTDAATQQALIQHLAAHHRGVSASSSDVGAAFTGVDVVTSDMCPNRMGGFQDRQRIAQLNLEAVDVCAPLLRTGGHFVCKVLGSRPAYEELWHRLSRFFLAVHVCKPPASRVHSDEAFVVALDKLDTPRPASGLRRAADVGRSMRGVAAGAGADGGGGHFGLDDWPGFSRRSGRPRRG